MPDHVFPYMNLGFSFLGQGRIDEAKATFERSVSNRGSRTTNLTLLGFGLIAHLEGDEAAAKEYEARIKGRVGEGRFRMVQGLAACQSSASEA